MKKRRDTIAELEALHFTVTMHVEDIVATLAPLLRIQHVLYRAISDARSKASNKMLCQLIQAENAPHREGKGARRPGARKGAKRGRP